MKQRLKCVWPKITQGEWYIDKPMKRKVFAKRPKRGDEPLIADLLTFQVKPEDEANARLIAASPKAFAYLVKDWERMQANALFSPSWESTEAALRTLLESAGFTFAEVDNDTDVVNTKIDAP